MSVFIFIGGVLPVSAATKATTHRVATKVTTKKVAKKKKVTKKKERLIANPPLITLDNAPHSPKPYSAKSKKKTTPKKVLAIKKN